MHNRRLVLAALLALAAGCAGPDGGPRQASDPLPAPGYYVMRHLHTPAGQRDPDLTAEGQRVAALVPNWFGRDRVRVIYVSHFKRTQQTAAPLAGQLGLVPVVYDPADTPALIARVRAGPLPALIVGHSNTVPEIVAQLGGTRPGPLVHEDFGDIWRIAPDGATVRRPIEDTPGI